MGNAQESFQGECAGSPPKLNHGQPRADVQVMTAEVVRLFEEVLARDVQDEASKKEKLYLATSSLVYVLHPNKEKL